MVCNDFHIYCNTTKLKNGKNVLCSLGHHSVDLYKAFAHFDTLPVVEVNVGNK